MVDFTLADTPSYLFLCSGLIISATKWNNETYIRLYESESKKTRFNVYWWPICLQVLIFAGLLIINDMLYACIFHFIFASWFVYANLPLRGFSWVFLPPIGWYELSPLPYIIEWKLICLKKIWLIVKYSCKIYEIGEMLSTQKKTKTL